MASSWPTFRLPAQPPSATRSAGGRVPRAADITLLPLRAPRQKSQRRADTRSSPKRSKSAMRSCRTKARRLEGQSSIQDFFYQHKRAEPIEINLRGDQPSLLSSASIPQSLPTFTNSSELLSSALERCVAVQKLIKSGDIPLHESPWVSWSCVNEVLKKKRNQAITSDATSVLLAKMDMQIFAWAPDLICPGLQMRCPSCRKPSTSSEWSRPRVVHGLAQAGVYTTSLYTCLHCSASPRLANSASTRHATRVRKKFSADLPEVLALLPKDVLAKRELFDTGRILYEAPVLDFVRSMSTKTSWSGIAEVLSDMKTAFWVKSVRSAWRALQIAPSREEIEVLPRELALSAEWVRNLYVADAKARSQEVAQELEAEVGDDILMLDWTKDAATRSSSKWLFNAMDSRCRLVGFKLTRSSKPREVKDLMARFARRGVRPSLIYVDDECCGQWRSISAEYWPQAHVRLDPFHAIRRLTKTVSSLQHPWHAEFCSRVSEAIYEYDADMLSRLKAARASAGLCADAPRAEVRKYVPRRITNESRIVAKIEETLKDFEGRRHADAGPLLTEATQQAWSALKLHVTAGCLCDPSGVQLCKPSGRSDKLGGQDFYEIRSRRGSSALEGFHVHQKQWLGTFASHALEAGTFLLADGAVRWNRKRKKDSACRDVAPSS